ncbi:hypothetical protein [Myceligenerans indicum]|uniref:Uncharacterized protein n=1 Tax=Myceligenerans indicum TaxID=2593663 RepID=A0ABS1LEL5_9MICO|nr:hypothetical protein [Myceligenerans indicum]MBL0884725.1 hypothetical protein [Myceligenerans indicum]
MNVHDTDRDTNAGHDGVLRRMRGASGTIAPPPALDGAAMAAAAVRKVRRRRLVTAVGGGVVGVLVLAAGALAVTGDLLAGPRALPGDDGTATASPTPSAEPSVRSSGSATAEPLDPPKGWQTGQFYGLAYAMPRDWGRPTPDGWEPADLSAGDWGTSELLELQRVNGEAVTGSFALRVDAYDPWFSYANEDEDVREHVDIPGAESAELLAGTAPTQDSTGVTDLEWVALKAQQSGGIWYTAWFTFPVGDEPDVMQFGREFAQTVAFTVPTDDIWALARSQGKDLSVHKADQNVPDSWETHSVNGLALAVPPDMAEGSPWEEETAEGLAEEELELSGSSRDSWMEADGVALDVDSYIDVNGRGAVSPLGFDGTLGGETVDIDGAGRVVLFESVSRGFPGGATTLDVELEIWDEELRSFWTVQARFPDTEEGRRTADRLLGSLRLTD